MRTEARGHGDKPIIKWLELAISPRWQEEGRVAAVHPMGVGERQPCFGITLDQRWLCSSDGALTIFDSMAAATRFLQLLKMDRLAMGGDCAFEAVESDPFQCFHLDANGLTVCRKCRAGDHAHWLAAWDETQLEEDW
jgi:hypothetical protein